MTTTTTTTQSRQARRVLVVEDEPRLRDLLLDTIPEMGYAASAARSAEEAQRLMEDEPRDIVILDLQLPGMDGMAFFEKLRQRWRQAEVVILTGFGDLPAARRAIELGVVAFLSKPFHQHEIEAALAQAAARIARVAETPDDSADRAEAIAPAAQSGTEPPALTLADAEYRHIRAALQRHHGNRSAAAIELGISRRTLHARLARYRAAGHAIDD